MGACPYNLDVRDFLQKVKRGSMRGAYNILVNTLLFPETLCTGSNQPCPENHYAEHGQEKHQKTVPEPFGRDPTGCFCVS